VARKGRGLSEKPEFFTIDHYNAKWAVRAVDFLWDHQIATEILEHPSHVVCEVFECEILPQGRFGFYNGTAGALADMIPHLVQPVWAAAKAAKDPNSNKYPNLELFLKAIDIETVERARYEVIPELLYNDPAERYPYSKLKTHLYTDTETYGCIHAKFTDGAWKGATLCLRTGKGMKTKSKGLSLFGKKRSDGSHDVLVFDIADARVTLRGRVIRDDNGVQDDDGVIMQTTEIRVPGIAQTATARKTDDFVEIFKGLVTKDPNGPDKSFYPSPSDAGELFNKFASRLVEERKRGTIEEYPPYSRNPSECRPGSPCSFAKP
jgi:glucose-6-phosphate 1-dehydrogenase